jgi:hypothetical protein
MGAPDFDRFLNGDAQETPESIPASTNVDPNDPNRLAVMLDAVSARALAKLDEFLTLPIDTSDGNRTRAQSAAINAALSTQAKVDEMRLRQRSAPDILPKIIEMMRQEKERLLALGETLEPE